MRSLTADRPLFRALLLCFGGKVFEMKVFFFCEYDFFGDNFRLWLCLIHFNGTRSWEGIIISTQCIYGPQIILFVCVCVWFGWQRWKIVWVKKLYLFFTVSMVFCKITCFGHIQVILWIHVNINLIAMWLQILQNFKSRMEDVRKKGLLLATTTTPGVNNKF